MAVGEYGRGGLVVPPENVREVRELLGLDRTTLGKMAGVDGRTVGRIERRQQVQELSLQAVLGSLISEVDGKLSVRQQRLMTGWLEYFDGSSDTDDNKTLQDLPEQNSIVRFGLSKNGKLALVPGPDDDNDNDTIAAYRDEILDALQTLSERYSTNPNAPQVSLFRPLISRYEQTLSSDLPNINFAILFALGTRLYSARKTAQREIANGDWPESEAVESAAIDTVCDLHGPMMMASATGRRLVRERDEFDATPETLRREDDLIQEFGKVLAEAEDAFEPDTREAIKELSTTVSDDAHPARGRMLRMAFVSSALIGVVGVVGSEASIWLRTIVGSTGWFGLEVLKQTDDFKHTRDALAKSYNQTAKSMDELLTNTVDLRAALKKLVDRKAQIFEKVATLKPEFSWAKRLLSATRNKEPSSLVKTAGDKRSIIVIGDVAHADIFALQLAKELRVPFFNLAERMSDKVDSREIDEFAENHSTAAIADLAENTLIDTLIDEPAVVLIDRMRHGLFRNIDLGLLALHYSYVCHFTDQGRQHEPGLQADITMHAPPSSLGNLVHTFAENYLSTGSFHTAEGELSLTENRVGKI